jgi:hypothetical protein
MGHEGGELSIRRDNHMKLSHSMALALAMSLGSMSLAQDLATDVGKGVKDTEKATKTVAKDMAAAPEKQLKIRVIRSRAR